MCGLCSSAHPPPTCKYLLDNDLWVYVLDKGCAKRRMAVHRPADTLSKYQFCVFGELSSTPYTIFSIQPHFAENLMFEGVITLEKADAERCFYIKFV